MTWWAVPVTSDWHKKTALPWETDPSRPDTFEYNPLYREIVSSKELMFIPSVAPDTSPGTVVWFGGIAQSWKYELNTQVDLVHRGFSLIALRDSGLSRYVGLRVVLQDLPADLTKRFTLEFQLSLQELSSTGRFLEIYNDAGEAGRSLAKDLNKSILDASFAATGGLLLRDKHNPSQRDKPLIVVGCSGGAPAAMAFASLHRDRVAGLILIGAGGNLVELLKRTDLNNNRDVVTWRDDTPLSEQRDALAGSFNAQCLVDPLLSAKSIPTDRVLMIQARFDSVVPADLGDALWESLGRPERWNFFGGHRLLFWRLSSYGNEIAAWAEAKANAALPSRGTPPAPH